MKQNTAVICLSKVNGGMELASVKLARLLSNDVRIDFIAKTASSIEKKSNNDFSEHNIHLYTIDFDKYFSLHLIKRVSTKNSSNTTLNTAWLKLFFPTTHLTNSNMDVARYLNRKTVQVQLLNICITQRTKKSQ